MQSDTSHVDPDSINIYIYIYIFFFFYAAMNTYFFKIYNVELYNIIKGILKYPRLFDKSIEKAIFIYHNIYLHVRARGFILT